MKITKTNTPAPIQSTPERKKEMFVDHVTSQIQFAAKDMTAALLALTSVPLSHLGSRMENTDALFANAAIHEVYTQVLRLSSLSWEDLLKEIQRNIQPVGSSSTSPITNFMSLSRLNAWLAIHRDVLSFSKP